MCTLRERALQMQRTTTYREQSRVFLAQAHEELAKGDLQQASEKGWGTASQMVKAVAQERGWLHRSHRHLQNAVDELRMQTGDEDLDILFGAGENLHQNFYENWYSADSIALRLRLVERFVDKAEGLLVAAA